MTLRHAMLEAASRAPRLLGESRGAVAAFLRAQQNPDGGFRGRGDQSDLYYAVFAVEGLVALGEPPDPDPLRGYLASFGDGEGLDFVHLACLARSWADAGESGRDLRAALIRRIEGHRSADAGYAPSPGAEHGTAYGCFLALGALEDLGAEEMDKGAILRCLAALRRDDGGYANERALLSSTTPATAAAVSVAKHMTGTADKAAAGFLVARAAADGGFFVTATAPFPDLLSTATALHALAGLTRHSRDLVQSCTRFVEGLRTDAGGYLGLWLDEAPDAEYTFYALLALGHLS
ncbi:MAG TPA: prenyltransferase/squalene oxidase repeat-containing protein [Planctomycetota bacterium]|nr:prenyltransferase/squalene oxidase repeat-containing protein [Planctomycetota bacterium]